MNFNFSSYDCKLKLFEEKYDIIPKLERIYQIVQEYISIDPEEVNDIFYKLIEDEFQKEINSIE